MATDAFFLWLLLPALHCYIYKQFYTGTYFDQKKKLNNFERPIYANSNSAFLANPSIARYSLRISCHFT